MDLRSSRSRSRTPFVQLTRLEEENMANSIKQKTIERRTYSTRQKTIERLATSDEVFIEEPKLKQRDNRRHKTSDYSSEEEHTENGTSKTALQVYKEAGEYWNTFPKTDYTYSISSKDRMEIAPGVPCMPNMSRKSLRRSMEPTPRYGANEAHEMTSKYETSKYEMSKHEMSKHEMSKHQMTSNNIARKTLNFDDSDHFTTTKKYSAVSYTTSITRRIHTVIRRFYQSITALFLAVYTAAESSVLWTARTYYQTVSRLFLFDTWLMQKSSAPAAAQSTRKYGALIAIMFLPLLLFAGWTLWSNISEIYQENPTKATIEEKIPVFDVNTLLSNPQFDRIISAHLDKKISNFAADLSSIKTRINEIDAGLRAQLFRLETNKCCRRQFIYLMNDNKRQSYVDADELKRSLNKLRADLSVFNNDNGGVVTDAQIRKIVQESLAVYDADKTGLVDYALESSGGQIVSTRCTENYHSRTAVVSILGVPLWYPSNTPRVVITPGVTPGECWAFQNFPGFVVIQLSAVVKVSAVSVEHIPETLAPGGARDSAPRVFSVWGLKGENDREPWDFGTFEYRLEGPPLQYFAVDERRDAPPVNMVELRVESNHGNINYTCLYRFRVHGNQT